jgi:hypothetical protein
MGDYVGVGGLWVFFHNNPLSIGQFGAEMSRSHGGVKDLVNDIGVI